MSPTVTTFLFEAANFLVLAAVLGWLFFKPVRQAIADHRAKFESDNEQAAMKLAEAETMRKEIQEAHTNLQAELNDRRTSELAVIKGQAEQVLADARAAADRQREQSHLRASRMSDSQRDTLAEVAAAAAANAVGELLQQINGPELQSALVQSACRQLEQFSHNAIAPVKIESAKPLSEEQVEAIKSVLGTAGDSADFRTVEEMGVGIRILTASGLVDASASGLSHFARHWLVKEMHHRANNHDPMQGVNNA